MIKEYFWVAFIGVLLNAVLIIANASGLLPLPLAVFSLVFLAFFFLALFRPLWVFWIFIISLPLESVIISSEQIPISFRPFQVIGLMLFIATGLLIISKKKTGLPELPKINWFDGSILVLCGWSFLSLLETLNFGATLKLNLVLLSFGMLYFLARFYFQKQQQKLEALWFFVATSFPILIFGIYQAVAFKLNWVDFQVFAERSNGTFTEPDWFGIYLVFLAALIYWVKLQLFSTRNTTMIGKKELRQVGQWFLNFYLFLIFLVLLLTVARSAWLGFLGLTIVYFILLIWQKSLFKLKNFTWKSFLRDIFSVGVAYLISILVVISFGLSNFNLFDRASSSVSGLQEITISCEVGFNAPSQISGIEELEKYSCRHINLDEINKEIISGNNVQTVLRPDPNIEIRKDIYATTWREIKNHFWIGQGLGSSAEILGTDSYGHGLNASNIFLEIWFSWGIIGLIVFFILFGLPVIVACKNILKRGDKINLSLFVILTSIALIIPNLFNAGLFLSILWIWLAVVSD